MHKNIGYVVCIHTFYYTLSGTRQNPKTAPPQLRVMVTKRSTFQAWVPCQLQHVYHIRIIPYTSNYRLDG